MKFGKQDQAGIFKYRGCVLRYSFTYVITNYCW